MTRKKKVKKASIPKRRYSRLNSNSKTRLVNILEHYVRFSNFVLGEKNFQLRSEILQNRAWSETLSEQSVRAAGHSEWKTHLWRFDIKEFIELKLYKTIDLLRIKCKCIVSVQCVCEYLLVSAF